MNVKRLMLATVMVAGLSTFGSYEAFAIGEQFFAVLSGGNEVGANGQANAGDPNGYGTASVIFVSNDRLCVSVLINRIDNPTEFHIHEAPAGREGPVVVPFIPPNAGNPGTASSCVSNINTAVLQRIRNNPTNFYINVHTTAFPEGAVRGQLF